MESRDFCFWLQGFFELSDNSGPITAGQTTVISRHLDLVFAHQGRSHLRERPARAPEPPLPVPAPPSPQPVHEEPAERPEREAPYVHPEPPRC